MAACLAACGRQANPGQGTCGYSVCLETMLRWARTGLRNAKNRGLISESEYFHHMRNLAYKTAQYNAARKTL